MSLTFDGGGPICEKVSTLRSFCCQSSSQRETLICPLAACPERHVSVGALADWKSLSSALGLGMKMTAQPPDSVCKPLWTHAGGVLFHLQGCLQTISLQQSDVAPDGNLSLVNGCNHSLAILTKRGSVNW